MTRSSDPQQLVIMSHRLVGRQFGRLNDGETRASMNRLTSVFQSVAIASLLAGCVRPPLIPEAPSNARICCTSLASLPTQPLQLGESVSIAFDAERSPVFTFPEGNGAFAAFQLPDGAAGSTLRLRAFVSSSTLPLATIVRANVIFLDAQHAPIAAAREAALKLERRVFRTSYGDGVFAVPPAAAYAIVYTGSPRSARAIATSENGTRYAIPFSYTGDVDVLLQKAPQ
ncbi:MalM family protein [Cupriavidus pauculus]|uniref:MalM family protein n=1 Tax=Cupriavidus pauculus TaxID=82633 RepID=UPI001D0C3131|nr:MalM family protein [Cupriavidus pauculus]